MSTAADQRLFGYNSGMTELFEYDDCPSAVDSCSDYLLKQLNSSQGSILLMLSGGSSLNPVRETFKKLKDDVLSRINVAQIDGRFIGFEEEANNWRQIEEALKGKLDKLAGYLVIMKQGVGPDDIAISYEMELRSLLATADEKIGVYGVGADGHIAGMMPSKNPEDFMHFLDGRLVVTYEAHDYVRITTTQPLITKLDEAIVFACGQDKVKAIEKLDKNLSPREHPAQFLKDAARATIFLGKKM